MLFEKAEGAVPGNVLREKQNNYVDKNERQSQSQGRDSAEPSQQEIWRCLALFGTSNCPARHQSGGKSEDPIRVADIHTTIQHSLGINHAKELMTPILRPMALSDGRVIKTLLK